MGRRKRNNLLSNALEKLQIQENDIYTWRENDGNIVIVTLDGRRCLYHAKGSIPPHKDYHRIFSERDNHA